MSDPQDVSGVWYGHYSADHGFEDNGFIAHLEEAGGVVTGTITEPDGARGGIRRALVQGSRDGASLHFAKHYDGSGGWYHVVDYAGQVDAEGTLVAGHWVVEGLTGGFDMTREKFDAEELEDEEVVGILVPSNVGRGFPPEQ